MLLGCDDMRDESDVGLRFDWCVLSVLFFLDSHGCECFIFVFT